MSPTEIAGGLLENVEKRIADKVVVHASYNARDPKYDIALLRIPKPQALPEPNQTLTKHNCISIPRDKKSIREEEYVPLEIAGYGALGRDDTPTKQMMKGELWYTPGTCVKRGCEGDFPREVRDNQLAPHAFCLAISTVEASTCIVSHE